ncbi:MAG: hypothetical protein ACREBU_21780, partial [Nitrososphaera sp.]
MNKKFSARSHVKVSIVLLMVFVSLMSQTCEAQESIFVYLQQALGKIVLQSEVIKNLANYDYVSGNCLFGAYLKNGESQNLTMTFQEGIDYLIIGAGDDDIADLDLKLLSTTGGVLAEDTDSDATPILKFSPGFSRKVTLQIKNYNSARSGFCVFVILQESYSGNFSMRQIAEALDNVITGSQIPYLFASRFARNTFCLFGGRLNEGEATDLF